MKRIFFDLNDCFLGLNHLLEGFFGYAATHGWDVTFRINGNLELGRLYGKFDGAFLCNVTDKAIRNTLAMAQHTLVFASCDEPFEKWLHVVGLNYVHCDNLQIGRSAAEYFIVRGYRDFAYVSVSPHTFCWPEYRFAGFKASVEKAGFQVHRFNERGTDYKSAAREDRALAKFLSALPRPCALLVANDSRAHHILSVCRESGMKVTSDIAVLGVDNMLHFCLSSSPSLSSVDVITVATGDTCAATLNRIMSGERLSEFIPIGSLAIHTRGSTEDSSRDNKALDAALAYINDHIYETLTVRDIAKKVGIPVRTLFNITDERLGHTLKQEIIYRRLEATAARLLTTSDTVSDIALRYAFSDTAAFSNAFRKRFGKTPTEYRRSQR